MLRVYVTLAVCTSMRVCVYLRVVRECIYTYVCAYAYTAGPGIQPARTMEQLEAEEAATIQFINSYIHSNPDITHQTKWTTNREIKLRSAAETNLPPLMLHTKDLIKRIKHTLMDRVAASLSAHTDTVTPL